MWGGTGIAGEKEKKEGMSPAGDGKNASLDDDRRLMIFPSPPSQHLTEEPDLPDVR